MIIQIQLKDKENPMEYTTIESVRKTEYRYNKPSERYMLYLETDESFIAVGIEDIESIEIKE